MKRDGRKAKMKTLSIAKLSDKLAKAAVLFSAVAVLSVEN